MEVDDTKYKYVSFLLCIIIGILIGYNIRPNKKQIPIHNNIEINDTTYNHIVLDSISHNIHYRDSIIYTIREEQYEKIEEIKHYSDSATIELFYKLLSR